MTQYIYCCNALRISAQQGWLLLLNSKQIHHKGNKPNMNEHKINVDKEGAAEL